MARSLTFILAVCLPAFFWVILTAAQEVQENPGPSPALSAVLHRLEEKMSGLKTLKTDFVEEKKLSAFRNSIRLRGHIYMERPGKLIWHVDEPVRYSVLITEEYVRQWDEDTNRVQEIPLSNNPVLRTVFSQMTVWLNGQFTTLLQEYKVELIQESPVVLACVPRDENVLKKVVKQITLSFQEDETYLKQIIILEAGGDSTTISFHDTVLNVPLDNRDFEVKGHV